MKLLLSAALACHGAVIDDGFDCRLRKVALDYAEDVVLKQWSEERAQNMSRLIAEGLNIAECGSVLPLSPPMSATTKGRDVGASAVAGDVEIFVSANGDDDATGTREAPLRSISGAQASIRARWPEPSTRPPIAVRLRSGSYYGVKASFSAADSGATVDRSIVYAPALNGRGQPEAVSLKGGIDLNSYKLTWAPAASPQGAFVATLPSEAPRPQLQDQLFLSEHPLVRARVPNGRPWIPLDGFNLTAGRNYSATAGGQMPDVPTPVQSCEQSSDFPCQRATAVCKATNATQWPMGHATSVAYLGNASAKALGARIEMEECLEHLRTDNEWPIAWGAMNGFGHVEKDNATHTWINKLDETHNVPMFYGPWARGLAVDMSQDTGGLNLSSVSWREPAGIVVHAMADGEWGGVQYRVAPVPVEQHGDQAILKFQYGGWQQARGALLYGDASERAPHGNRFYMEGSLDFLDVEGEWHFEESSRKLYVFPPKGLVLDAELLLTQEDRLFEFVGTEEDRVRNIALMNMTLGYTSAQFFKPHEESSGGDYAVHRGAAIFAENAHNLTFANNDIQHVGGNAVFLSNAVGDVRISSNCFRFIGTSGVSVVGRTGQALGDGRDGEAIKERHGAGLDNGVRLPHRNTIDHNVFADLGVWDKQSACYHKAVTAPGNVFLNNVCFNTSRHAVNYQDSMNGGGAVEGNLFFNLNRETRDTAAFNSWGRRTYLLSDENDPATPRLVPRELHSVRRNLVLTRNYHAAGYQDNGDGLRCDDAASWYNMSGNVLYKASMEFNGGSQIWTHGNLFLRAGWHLCQHLTFGGSTEDMFVDPDQVWRSICGSGATERCAYFWAPVDPTTGQRPANYFGDRNIIANSNSTLEWSQLWCGMDLATWRSKTGQDSNTSEIKDSPEWQPDAVVARAGDMLRTGAMALEPPTVRPPGAVSVFV